MGFHPTKQMELSHIVSRSPPDIHSCSHSLSRLRDNGKPSFTTEKCYPLSLKHHEGTGTSKFEHDASSKPSSVAAQLSSSFVSVRNHIIEERKSLQQCCNALATTLSAVSVSQSSSKALAVDQDKEATGQDLVKPIDHNCEICGPKDVSSSEEFPLVAVIEDTEDWKTISDRKTRELPFSLRDKGKELRNWTTEKSVYSSENGFLSILNSFPLKGSTYRSRKKLLILDINGILADIVYPPPKGCNPDIKIAGRAVFRRPFCRDFLNFCLERFDVGIWSSRSRKIVDRVVDYLLGDLKHKLTLCWDMSYCTESKFKTLENRHKTLVFKELNTIWKMNDSFLPWEKGPYNESNTLLLDDSPYKALLNPPHTAIFPYPFKCVDQADNSIGPGGNLRLYLERLAAAEDVQKYVEDHPFGQSAITERSLSWQFYSKVIERQCDMARW